MEVKRRKRREKERKLGEKRRIGRERTRRNNRKGRRKTEEDRMMKGKTAGKKVVATRSKGDEGQRKGPRGKNERGGCRQTGG